MTDSTDDDGEYPVAYLDTAGKKLYGKQPSFAYWLRILIETQNEVIRTLYAEDVLFDEIRLGCHCEAGKQVIFLLHSQYETA